MTGTCVLIGLILSTSLKTEIVFVAVHPSDVPSMDLVYEAKRVARAPWAQAEMVRNLPGYPAARNNVSCAKQQVRVAYGDVS